MSRRCSTPATVKPEPQFQAGLTAAVHQVRMNAPIQLAASWVALEDVTPGSGELVYYPGSHRWEVFLFSGRFKHYDEERDGVEQLQQWYRWLDEEAHRRGCEKVSFLPSKGGCINLARWLSPWRCAGYP